MSDNNIRVERARIRMSQEELAKKVEVSRQTIHSIETGKFVPSLTLAQKIAKFFKKSTDEVFPNEQ